VGILERYDAINRSISAAGSYASAAEAALHGLHTTQNNTAEHAHLHDALVAAAQFSAHRQT
jgi:hypothetical protein